MGIMGQCGYDNIPENNNSLMRFQKNAKTLEDFLGTDGLRQYEFLMKSAERTYPWICLPIKQRPRRLDQGYIYAAILM